MLPNANTVTLISAPSPWMGEDTQGVPGEGVRRAAAPTLLIPSLSRSGERGSIGKKAKFGLMLPAQPSLNMRYYQEMSLKSRWIESRSSA